MSNNTLILFPPVGLKAPKLAWIEKAISYSYLVGLPARAGRTGSEVLGYRDFVSFFF